MVFLLIASLTKLFINFTFYVALSELIKIALLLTLKEMFCFFVYHFDLFKQRYCGE